MYTYIYRERERDISLSLWIPEIVLTDTLSAGASCGDPATELPSTSIVLVLVLVLCVYIYIYIHTYIQSCAGARATLEIHQLPDGGGTDGVFT